jgi:hypothetical protein
MGWLLAALAAFLFAPKKSGGSSAKVTEGTAFLFAGKTYRIELEVNGPALLANPLGVAQGIDNGLRMAGAYDVLVQPSIPLMASYSLVPAGDLPVVLNVAAQQTIGGIAAEYTFRSVQQIAGAKRLAA